MKPFLLLVILLNAIHVLGQIHVGPIERAAFRKDQFKQINLDKLKSSKTLFVYRDSDEDQLELLKQELREAWNYTELEFISFEEFTSNTYNEDYSFFTIEATHHIKTSRTATASGTSTRDMVTENSYIHITLWMKKNDKKLTFCRIDLYPTFPTYEIFSNHIRSDKQLVLEHLYKEAVLHNWNLVYLKNALQFVNKKLANSEEHWLFHRETHSTLSHLKNDTLYIPEYVLIKFAPFGGDESKRHQVKKMFKRYQYPFKVLSIAEISEKIKNSNQNTYYLSFVKSSSKKFISVVNGTTGDFIYSRYSLGYNVRKKNLFELSNTIRKCL